MDGATWIHLCAVALQERANRLPDDLADLMAEQLALTSSHLSPWAAAEAFYAAAFRALG